MAGIIASLITGGLALIGVIITNMQSNKKIGYQLEKQLEKQQAITDTKLEELTREVREHNNFAKRMPVVEEQIKVINNRLDGLEKGR